MIVADSALAYDRYIRSGVYCLFGSLIDFATEPWPLRCLINGYISSFFFYPFLLVCLSFFALIELVVDHCIL